ncbi:MAG: translation initiation inhibitor [Phycisphaerae bacterium]
MTVVHSSQILRQSTDTIFSTILSRGDHDEIFITAQPLAHECLDALLIRVAHAILALQAQPVAMTVLTTGVDPQRAQQTLNNILGGISFPITWLISEASGGNQPVGVEVRALRGCPVRPIYLHGRVVGSVWEDAHARHCELGDLRALDTQRSPAAQTRAVLNDMSAALAQAGMTFAQVYRTWYRNRAILSWYDDFNRVRTEMFRQWRVFDGLLPASTGISADNPYGAALVAGLWATQAKTPEVRAYTVASPLQDPATDYGSSFSRAVEVDQRDHRRITISGTASIDKLGHTAHVGDIHAQVALIMRVVHAILTARGMDWTDVTRGLAYFRHAQAQSAFAQWCQTHVVAPMPIIVCNHTVCRDDLLYEIELDALTMTPG